MSENETRIREYLSIHKRRLSLERELDRLRKEAQSEFLKCFIEHKEFLALIRKYSKDLCRARLQHDVYLERELEEHVESLKTRANQLEDMLSQEKYAQARAVADQLVEQIKLIPDIEQKIRDHKQLELSYGGVMTSDRDIQ